jgi:hypothetical protein
VRAAGVPGLGSIQFSQGDAHASHRDPAAIGGGRKRRRLYVFLHALAVSATVNFVRHERTRGRAGASVRIDVAIVVLVVACAFVAHLLGITVWAVVFVLCGEFPEFGIAYYHSAVNYTTLGYGDVIMTPSWRLLGPLEAADGALMFGVSTAMIFAVIHRLIQDRFVDLRD